MRIKPPERKEKPYVWRSVWRAIWAAATAAAKTRLLRTGAVLPASASVRLLHSRRGEGNPQKEKGVILWDVRISGRPFCMPAFA